MRRFRHDTFTLGTLVLNFVWHKQLCHNRGLRFTIKLADAFCFHKQKMYIFRAYKTSKVIVCVTFLFLYVDVWLIIFKIPNYAVV